MRLRWVLIPLLTIFGILAGQILPVSAARGVPGSPELGIGARLSVVSPHLPSDLLTVADLKLDWLSIDVPWSHFYPQKETNPDWTSLDLAVQTAQNNHIAVMLSISNPPAWSITELGPDPTSTQALVDTLVNRFPNAISAFELFPGINTQKGWGANPNPEQFLKMYRQISSGLAAKDRTILTLPGSLEAFTTPASPADRTDVDYLNALFSLDASIKYPVIGLRLPEIQGEPATPSESQLPPVLRHYEKIREIIKASGRPATLLWITYLGFQTPMSPDRRSAFLTEAYTQIRSQLYIGAAFIQGINTCTLDSSTCSEVSLRQADGSLHSFYPTFHTILMNNAKVKSDEIPGHAKSMILTKHRSN